MPFLQTRLSPATGLGSEDEPGPQLSLSRIPPITSPGAYTFLILAAFAFVFFHIYFVFVCLFVLRIEPSTFALNCILISLYNFIFLILFY